jgi:DNA gyrase/topoisomerase IV subunit A
VLTYNSKFEKELKQLIQQAIEERKELLSTGLSTVDFETYRYHVGIIKGLRMAIELCDEATLIVERRDNN